MLVALCMHSIVLQGSMGERLMCCAAVLLVGMVHAGCSFWGVSSLLDVTLQCRSGLGKALCMMSDVMFGRGACMKCRP